MTDDGPRSPACGICSMCHPAFPCRPDCHICWPAARLDDLLSHVSNHQQTARAETGEI